MVDLTDKEKLIIASLYIMKNPYSSYDQLQRLKLLQDYSKSLNRSLDENRNLNEITDSTEIYLDIKRVEDYFTECLTNYMLGIEMYDQNHLSIRNSEQYLICMIELMFSEGINVEVKANFQHYLTKQLNFQNYSQNYLNAMRDQINYRDDYIRFYEKTKSLNSI